MIRVGLTGNIGSGKSRVATLFSALGHPVFNSDEQGNRISKSVETIAEISTIFGTEIVTPEGAIDRKRLAQIVFSDPEKLKQLNQIIHPKVERAWKQFCRNNQRNPIVICESAILFESGFNKFTDFTICVTADEQIRIRRVMVRDNLSENQVRERIKNQWNESRLIANCDATINNSGTQLLIPQIETIINRLKK